MSGPLDRFARPCFEGFTHNDEKKESRSDADNSEGDKKTKMGSFKKKAINAGNKFRHSLRRRSKKKNDNRVSIEDIRDIHIFRLSMHFDSAYLMRTCCHNSMMIIT